MNIVLVHPEIPHNTGAVGRVCVGLGSRLHLIRPLGFSLAEPYVRRSGLDYWKHLDLQVHDSWAAFFTDAQPAAFCFASTRGTRSVYDVRFTPETYLVFGNETSGLPAELYEQYADSLARIPMPGEHGRSLNLSNAVAVTAYEAWRQLNT